jgi:HupH hydrogenase expression protein, C-terminal conserved region
MSRLTDIPIKVIAGSAADVPLNGRAVLHELAAALTRLLELGETGSIDLRGLPLSAADYELLEDRLGRGEVRAELDALGRSSTEETAFAGIWWTRHYDNEGTLVGELLEVTFCPEILRSHPVDAGRGLSRLRAMLASESSAAQDSNSCEDPQ